MGAAASGRRRRPDAAWGLYRREEITSDLSARLAAGRWCASPMSVSILCTPKPRAIARPPFSDRVVHAALVGAVEPWWRARARPESMECRAGAGPHRAVLHLAASMRAHAFMVHLDIRAFFPCIHREHAVALAARRRRDPRLAAHIAACIAPAEAVYARADVRAACRLEAGWPTHGCGLTLGSSVSRWLAKLVVLDALDHHVKRTLRAPGYLRYVDDLILFADSRAALRTIRDGVVCWLRDERGLLVNNPDAPIRPCRGELNALGHRLRRDRVAPLPRAVRRLRARLRELVRRRAPRWRVGMNRSIVSSVGLLRFGA